MYCLKCGGKLRCIETFPRKDGAVRRRYKCSLCSARFSTYETFENGFLDKASAALRKPVVNPVVKKTEAKQIVKKPIVKSKSPSLPDPEVLDDFDDEDEELSDPLDFDDEDLDYDDTTDVMDRFELNDLEDDL